MIAALIRPRILSAKNRWRTASAATRIVRDTVIFFLSLTIMFAMYRGTVWALDQFTHLPFLVYLPPQVPLGLLLMFLFAMSIISALAHSIGHIYLADDLDLVLAAPTTPNDLFFARFGYVALSVSWMPFVFIMPVLIAMANTYHAPLSFLGWSLVGLLPYFLIPCAVATIAATLLVSLVDPRWTKFLVIGGIVAALAGIYSTADAFSTIVSSRSDPNQLLRLIQTVSSASSPWLPSTWLAAFLSDLLIAPERSSLLRLALLYSAALCLVSAACFITTQLHGYAYTKARNSSRETRREGAALVRPRRYRSTPTRAIIMKEFRSVFRDLAQSSQIVFLAGLCALYLTNVRLFLAIDTFPADARNHWQAVFLIMHAAITAFFTTSLCTRLVFSSVSLEGKQFWIMQIAPISIRSILHSKCLAWFIPISLLSAVLFSAGIYLIVERWDLTLLYTALSFFISYGIVASGIGLGAYFADFTWEHPSQLALSLGSFIYMLGSAVLIMVNLLPLSVILRLSPAASSTHAIYNTAWITLMAVAIIIANITIGRAAMALGEQHLTRPEA